MAVDRSFVEVNRAALARLRAFVDTASDDELAHPMEAGWTVASVLAHVAFWDLRVVACVEAWGPDGSGPVPTYHDDAVDWINDAAKPLISALEPRTAARVTVEAAESADRAVAGLSDELSARNEALGWLVNPDRADHRLEHLDEIERLLSRG
ncbi:MAG: maleylpyruvate isomerase N-terminal domain-containing protein [Actinomycetota bacterium]